MKTFIGLGLLFAAAVANADCASGQPWYMPKAVPPPGESTIYLLLEASAAKVMRVCFCTGDDDSRIVARTNTQHGPTQSTEIFKGGCADLGGTSVWLGNPNDRSVQGKYEVIATPAAASAAKTAPRRR